MKLITNSNINNPDYRGLKQILEFTGEDGVLSSSNSGQAAAATLAVHHGKISELAAMNFIEKTYKPDVLLGTFGTSKKRFLEISNGFTMQNKEVLGLNELKATLDANTPVALMLGTTIKKFIPAGKWVVAYAYDYSFIYMTNYEERPVSWAEFNEAWKGWMGWIPYSADMNEKGICWMP